MDFQANHCFISRYGKNGGYGKVLWKKTSCYHASLELVIKVQQDSGRSLPLFPGPSLNPWDALLAQAWQVVPRTAFSPHFWQLARNKRSSGPAVQAREPEELGLSQTGVPKFPTGNFHGTQLAVFSSDDWRALTNLPLIINNIIIPYYTILYSMNLPWYPQFFSGRSVILLVKAYATASSFSFKA